MAVEAGKFYLVILAQKNFHQTYPVSFGYFLWPYKDESFQKLPCFNNRYFKQDGLPVRKRAQPITLCTEKHALFKKWPYLDQISKKCCFLLPR
jgi:hypothetical protein